MPNLTEEARIIRNEYARKWRAKNKDKVAESNLRYWNKKAESIRENNV